MRTNIDIDDDLLAEAARLTGIKTKKDLVNQALRVLIESKKRKSIFELEGKIKFSPGYDYKAARGKS
jgi:Arc/MetJ family transcription regulator